MGKRKRLRKKRIELRRQSKRMKKITKKYKLGMTIFKNECKLRLEETK